MNGSDQDTEKIDDKNERKAKTNDKGKEKQEDNDNNVYIDEVDSEEDIDTTEDLTDELAGREAEEEEEEGEEAKQGKKKPKFVLSLDVGTTGIRAFLYDQKARRRAGSYRLITSIYPQAGWVEQDPQVLWDTCRKVMAKTMRKAKVKPSSIAAIGITTQRSSFLVWNKETGKPLCNFITWQDVRTADICSSWNDSYVFKGLQTLSKVAHGVTRSHRFLMMSLFKMSPLHVTPRLLWVLQNVDGAAKLAQEGKLLFGTVDTWLIWQFTGGQVHATDYSNASSTGLYDPFQIQWNQTLFSVVGVPPLLMPEVRPTSGSFGSTIPSIFGESIPIMAVVGDQQAALFAECCFGVGDCKITMGTGAFVDINTGSNVYVSKRGLMPLIAWKINDNVTYMVEGIMTNIGTVIEWGARELNLFDKPEESERMAETVENSDGVYLVPAFSGLSVPHQDPTARGTIIGLTTATKKQHIVRAMLESVGYTAREVLDAVKSDIPSVKISESIKVDGGVSNNDFVCRWMAEMTQKEIVRDVNPDQTTALGSAFLAGLAAGIWTSTKELEQVRQKQKVWTPSMNKSQVKRYYNEWKRAVDRSLQWSTSNGS